MERAVIAEDDQPVVYRVRKIVICVLWVSAPVVCGAKTCHCSRFTHQRALRSRRRQRFRSLSLPVQAALGCDDHQ